MGIAIPGHNWWHRSAFVLSFIFLTNIVPASAATVFDVKTFGAKGNGKSNDDAALKAAFDAANAVPGSTVYFPAGTYIFTTKLSAKGINVRGVRNLSVLKSNTSAALLQIGGKSIVQDLEIQGLADVGLSVVGGQDFAVKFVDFRSVGEAISIESSNKGSIDFCNVFVDNLRKSIECFDSPNITLTRCKFEGRPHVGDKAIFGPIFGRCANVKIQNNEFRMLDQPLLADNCQGVLVQQNQVRSAGIGLAANFSTNVNFDDNQFDGFESPGNAQLNDAYKTSKCTNVFIQRNDTRNIDRHSYQSVGDTNVRVEGNDFQTSDTGVSISDSKKVTVVANVIDRMKSGAISIENCTDEVGIFSNILANCDLDKTPLLAVIRVNCPAATSLRIESNRYAGNTVVIFYFIRCFQPSPPASVVGNITTTKLSTKVGP